MIRTAAKTLGVSIFFFCFFAVVSYAGFGVTPPFVSNSSLTRNAIYEQKIVLVRSDPRVDQLATVTIDAPEIADWIEIVEGTSFQLPRGEQKVPMTVRVSVPERAEFKRYTGAIRVKTGSIDDGQGRGAVNISLGAQIDVDLNVIDREIKEFRVRRVGIPDLNAGHKLGWLYFPGKIRFKMLVQNTGNVDVAPSDVTFKVYDVTGTLLLEETSHIGRIKKVAPYKVEDVVAELPTRLEAGTYLVRYEVKNDDTLVQSGDISMNILPYGSLQAAGFGFWGLSLPHKISVIMPIVGLIVMLTSIWYARRQRRMLKSV